MKKKIIIFSAGSAGREVFQLISIINKLNKKWEVVGYVDSDPKKVGKTIDGVKVFSVENKPKHKEIFATCGIMNPQIRKKIYEKEILNFPYKIINLIHPLNENPNCLKIGKGNIIFGNAHISFEVNLENFLLVSNFSDLGHNLIADNYVTIMPSVIIGGNCKIKSGSLIASGAIINQGTSIGKNCKIGMGTLVTKNLKDNISAIDYPRKAVVNNN